MRDATNKLLDLIKDGMITNEQVVEACMKYMSEDDVAGMCHANEFFAQDDEDEDTNPIRDIYSNGMCPDCGEDIPVDAEEGGQCENCGHVWCDTEEYVDNEDEDGEDINTP